MINVRLRSFGASNQGSVRERNEDQFLIADLKKSMLIRQTSLLVSTALDRGGSDNITVIVARPEMAEKAPDLVIASPQDVPLTGFQPPS